MDGLAPEKRSDKGVSKLAAPLQQSIIEAKQENPKRSIRQLVRLMEDRGEVPKGSLSRSTVHRLLQSRQLSRPVESDSLPVERRSYEARYAGDIWYGDVIPQGTLSCLRQFTLCTAPKWSSTAACARGIW